MAGLQAEIWTQNVPNTKQAALHWYSQIYGAFRQYNS
jgi:hypothetical protein